MHLYGAIQKVDSEARIVYGYASTETVDSSGEIVKKSAIEEALEDYLSWGNVREMHALSAVGKTVEASIDDVGLFIGAHIVDDAAWKKVKAGVYNGFSIGGKVLARDPKNRKIVTKVLLNEISIVDRPCNPDAKFDIWKAVGLSGVRAAPAPESDVARALRKSDETYRHTVDRISSSLQELAGLEARLTKVEQIGEASRQSSRERWRQ
jgi:HK97 family phage prohead protease